MGNRSMAETGRWLVIGCLLSVFHSPSFLLRNTQDVVWPFGRGVDSRRPLDDSTTELLDSTVAHFRATASR